MPVSLWTSCRNSCSWTSSVFEALNRPAGLSRASSTGRSCFPGAATDMDQGSVLAATSLPRRIQYLTLTAKSSRSRIEEQVIYTHTIIHPSNITTPAPQPGQLETYQPIANDTAVYAAASFIAMSMSEPPAPLGNLTVSPSPSPTPTTRQKKKGRKKLTDAFPTGHSPHNP